MKFSYVNPTQIHFGQGQIEALSKAIPTSSSVLVVYGGGSIKKNGVGWKEKGKPTIYLGCHGGK